MAKVEVMTERTCGGCDSFALLGECRFFPPQRREGMPFACYPVVRPDTPACKQWCPAKGRPAKKDDASTTE